MNENLLQIITGNLPGIVFTLDDTGLFTLIEGKGLVSLDLIPGELVGKSAFIFFRDYPEIVQSIQSALDGKEQRSIIKFNALRFEIQLSPIIEKKKINAVVGFATEIAEPGQSEVKDYNLTMFNDLPTPIWVEDLSALKLEFDRLRISGVTDFHQYFKEHPDVVPELMKKVRIIDVNQATVLFHHAKSKEELFAHFDDIFTDEGLPVLMEELALLAEGHTVIDLEEPTRTIDGLDKMVAFRCVVVPGAENDLSRILITNIDITESKKAAKELSQSVSLLQAALESSAEGILAVDKYGKVITYNQQFINLWNIPQNLITSREDNELINLIVDQFDDPEKFLKQVREVYDKPEAETFDYLTLKDGRTLERNSRPQRVGDEIIGRVWSMRDITQRKQAENALLASEERFRSIYENTTIGMYRTTPGGKILIVNPALLRMLGYDSFEELAKRDLETEGYDEGYERIEYRKQVESGALRGFESAWKRKDGSTVFVSESATAIRDEEDHVLYYEGTVEDITERHKLETEIHESLVKRGHQVAVTQQVAQEISTAADIETLFPLVVKLIKERFNYYHAQIFRFDPAQNANVLVSGYGDAGKIMLAAGHKVPLGQGVVGTAAKTGQAILASDAQKDRDWRPNPNLPDTAGELAVPIMFRDEILGILDVQSDKVGALTQDDVLLLENLAGQIAIAIENTRALEQAQIFRELVEAAGQGIGFTDLQGNILYINPSLAKMFGIRTPKEATGQPVLKYYHAAQRTLLQDALVQVARINQWTGEFTIKPVNGNPEISSSNNIFMIRDNKGTPRYYANVVTDITEQKRSDLDTQETLRELERLNRSINQSDWDSYESDNQTSSSYVFENLKIEEKSIWETEIATAIENQATTRSGDGTQTLIAPLSLRGDVIGALGVSGDKILSNEDVAMLESISEQVALAMESARLFNQTQHSLNDFALINRIVTTLGGSLDVTSGLQYAAEQMLTALNIGRVSITLYNEAKTNLMLAADAPFPADGKGDIGMTYPAIGDALANIVIQTQKHLFIYDAQNDPRTAEISEQLRQRGTQNLLLVPLVASNDVVGVVGFDTFNIERTFSDQEIRLIETIFFQVASSIRNAQLFETTQINEENFRNLVENAPEAIVVIDVTSGLFIDPNSNACKLYGMSGEDLLRVGPSELTPETQPDQRVSKDLIDEKIQEALLDRSPIFELQIKNATGQLIPCEVHLSRLPSERPLVRATVVDITERKKAEEEISKFKMGIERSGDAVFITDTNGTIIYVNPAFTTVYGFTEQEALGSNPRIFQSGLMTQENYKYFWDTLLAKGVVSGELINRRKDGRLVNIAGTNSPILDQADNIQGFMAVHHDISDTKKAEETLRHNEEALRRQNEYLATAAEVSRLVTSTLDLDTLFSRTVDLIRSRFGYYFVSIFTIDEAGFNAVLREGTGEVGVEMKKRKHSLAIGSRSVIGSVTANGETVIVNDTSNDATYRPNPLLSETRAEVGIPLSIGSRIIGALDIQSNESTSFHPDDIAVLETLADQISVALDNANSYNLAQKAVTEMRELDRIKSQFLANMSHELRTPLNSIIGFSRVILKGIDGPVSEQQHQDLSAIYNSGQHLLGLINDILDTSKMDAGKMELSLEELNIVDSINSALSTAAGIVKDKPVKLKTAFEPDLPTVRADPMRTRQILLNLISNASKFTEEGSVTVSAIPITGPTGRLEMQISVTDTGPGISPEDQAKLFLAFSQVDSSSTRKTGGTGLGLSICRRLVDLHGGIIGVHSAIGMGSTFYFTLPLFHQPKPEHVDSDNRIILCVDDDPQIVNLYERYLHPQGFKVVPVTNPASARDTAKRVKPYAITLDIMMPEIDGWTVLEQLKSDPETRNIPVIVCSIVEEEEKGFSLGAADYLVKPIMEDDLITALNRLNGNGMIKDVLIIDDSLDDLRLMEKIITERSDFRPILAEGGAKGWEILTTKPPHVVILDLFMPDVNGFTILERLRTSQELRDLPVVVVSGVDLNPEQKKQLENLGKHMLQKGMLDEKDLFITLEKALKRLETSQSRS